MTHEHNIVFWIEDSFLTENFGDPMGNGVVFLTPGRMWANEVLSAFPRLMEHPDTKGLTITRLVAYRHYDSVAFPGVAGSVHVVEASFGNAPMWEAFFETVQSVVYDEVGASGQFTRGRMKDQTMEITSPGTTRVYVSMLEPENNQIQAENIMSYAKQIARQRFNEGIGLRTVFIEPIANEGEV
jgi:hypothetical protein